MNIYVSGVNYKTTPLEIREKLRFSTEEQKSALYEISRLSSVNECVLLSTCNRTEVYIYSEDTSFDNSLIEKILCNIKGLNIYDFKKYFYVYSKTKAVKHLFKVASGLDSMVLGEDQILGQVKAAYELSLELGVSSGVLNTLFRDTITAAKKIKTNTGLSRNSVSVGSLAVKLLDDIYGQQLKDKCALVIGVGKIGSIVLKNLDSRGMRRIYATNRSHGKAEDLSKAYSSILPIDYNERYSVINKCDIVISSTSSPHYTITRDMLEKHIISKKKRVFIDLAVPRDFDEALGEMPDISCYNMDHLKTVADENMDRRIAEAAKAEQLIDGFVEDYEKWYAFRSVLPIVKDIQRYAEDVVSEKINYTTAKLKCASEEDKELVKATITNTVNEILNKLIYSVRENGSKDDMQAYFRCLRDAIKEN